MALKEEWERDSSHLTCRTESAVLGPLKSEHHVEAADITRGIRFLIERRLLNAVNRQDGRATLPSPAGLDYLAEHIAEQPTSKKVESPMAPQTSYPLSVFISHSARDEKLAEALVELLRNALNIPTNEIRCTSLNGYRLPAGAPIDEVLRREVHDSKAFIGLITPSSMESDYVMFELAARWGAKLHLVPLLGAGADSGFLRGPLATFNALNCDDAGQIHQLVDDLANLLTITNKTATAGYLAHVERLIKASKVGEVKEPSKGVKPPRIAGVLAIVAVIVTLVFLKVFPNGRDFGADKYVLAHVAVGEVFHPLTGDSAELLRRYTNYTNLGYDSFEALVQDEGDTSNEKYTSIKTYGAVRMKRLFASKGFTWNDGRSVINSHPYDDSSWAFTQGYINRVFKLRRVDYEKALKGKASVFDAILQVVDGDQRAVDAVREYGKQRTAQYVASLEHDTEFKLYDDPFWAYLHRYIDYAITTRDYLRARRDKASIFQAILEADKSDANATAWIKLYGEPRTDSYVKSL